MACFLVSHPDPLSFCRLSLQYHPDKNKNKGAQEKFAEINNGNVHLFHFSFVIVCHVVSLTFFFLLLALLHVYNFLLMHQLYSYAKPWTEFGLLK